MASDDDAASESPIDPFQEYFDVVATQGAYLLSGYQTPVFNTDRVDHDFSARLQSNLEFLFTVLQGVRVSKYGKQIADEWPMGRTPAEEVEKSNARTRELEYLCSAPTPSDASNSPELPSDFHDIVASKGAYLVTRYHTPVFQTDNANNSFVTELQLKLEFLLILQKARAAKYGQQVADEWPMSHTPLEAKEKYNARMKEMEAQVAAPSPSVDRSSECYREAEVSLVKVDSEASHLPHRLPTPSSSSPETVIPGDSPSAAAPDITVNKAPRGTKRRRSVAAEEEEAYQPFIKTRNTAMARHGRVGKTTQEMQRRRKGRQISDVARLVSPTRNQENYGSS